MGNNSRARLGRHYAYVALPEPTKTPPDGLTVIEALIPKRRVGPGGGRQGPPPGVGVSLK